MMISDNDRVNKQKRIRKGFARAERREINQTNNRYLG
jgi:hypothetical protein